MAKDLAVDKRESLSAYSPERKARVFISYSRKDAEFATWLGRGLDQRGIVVFRDIEDTLPLNSSGIVAIFEALRPLALHPSVRRLQFRNDTGHWNADPAYPDGLYWGVDYRAQPGSDWKLDLWFLREGTTQFDLQHIESLPPRLTPESRLAILRIKDAWHGRPDYGSAVRSYDIYEAVLDHDVRTLEGFEAYLARRGR